MNCELHSYNKIDFLLTCEVSVVAGHDGVLLPLGDVLSVPLANAGAASIGKDDAPKLPHSVSMVALICSLPGVM